MTFTHYDIPTQIENELRGVNNGFGVKDPTADIDFTQSAVGLLFHQHNEVAICILGRDFSKRFCNRFCKLLLIESAPSIIGYKVSIGKPLTFGESGTSLCAEGFSFQFIAYAYTATCT
jgi:hypothetical protein